MALLTGDLNYVVLTGVSTTLATAVSTLNANIASSVLPNDSLFPNGNPILDSGVSVVTNSGTTTYTAWAYLAVQSL